VEDVTRNQGKSDENRKPVTYVPGSCCLHTADTPANYDDTCSIDLLPDSL
jgi:hypothetical protein